MGARAWATSQHPTELFMPRRVNQGLVSKRVETVGRVQVLVLCCCRGFVSGMRQSFASPRSLTSSEAYPDRWGGLAFALLSRIASYRQFCPVGVFMGRLAPGNYVRASWLYGFAFSRHCAVPFGPSANRRLLWQWPFEGTT